MGQLNVDLGFDARTGHVLVDGQPHGEPVDFGAILKRVMKKIERRMEYRRGLLNTTSKRAHIWGSMPRPPEGNA